MRSGSVSIGSVVVYNTCKSSHSTQPRCVSERYFQCLKLSAFAAQTLADANLISMRSLILHSELLQVIHVEILLIKTNEQGSKEYRPRKKPTESGHVGANALFHCLTHETRLGGAITFVVFPKGFASRAKIEMQVDQEQGRPRAATCTR